jgi:hypothetical protein
VNYILKIRNQALLFSWLILISEISYTIACYMRWREPITLTINYMATVLGFSFAFIFIVPLTQKWIHSSNDK